MNCSRRTIRFAAALVGLLAVASACGGGGKKVASETDEPVIDDTETTDPSDESEDTESSEVPIPDPVVRTLDKAGWWGGFKITIDKASAEVDPQFGEAVDVTVDLTFENLGPEPATPPDNFALQRDDEVLNASLDAPSVAGQGKATGQITTVIHPDTDRDLASTSDESDATSTAEPADLDAILDSLTLVYGTAQDNQTKVPLTAKGKVETFEPKQLTLNGASDQDGLVTTVDGGWIVPSWQDGEKGKFEVHLTFTQTCHSGCPYGTNTDRGSFSLTSPAGESVITDDRSPFCCAVVVDGQVNDEPDQEVVFMVKEPVVGPYSFRASHRQGSSTPTPFTFTVS